MRYSYQIEWTEKHKLYGKVKKQFKTTECMVLTHELNLTNNPEVLEWNTTRIKYNKTTGKYENAN